MKPTKKPPAPIIRNIITRTAGSPVFAGIKDCTNEEYQ